MNEWKKPVKEEREIDLWRFLDVLIKRIWIILLVTVIFAIGGYVYTKLFVPKMYRAQFQVYITNRMERYEDVDADKTNTGDLNASIGLMYLYDEIISSRSVLVNAAHDAQLDYSYAKLKSMVSTKLPEKASMIEVTVIGEDPEEIVRFAEALAKRAERRGKEIEERSSMTVVDYPEEPKSPYAPNATGNGMIAAVIGCVLSYAVFVVIDLVNDRVKSSDDLENRYGLVVMGRIPDMAQSGKGYRYKYKYSYRRYNYGKGYGDAK